MSSKDKGKQNLKQSDYEYLKVPKEHVEIVLEELALNTLKGDEKVIEAIESIVHHKKESPIFVAIMDNGKLSVIRMPTELGNNPDVHDYMEKTYRDVDWMVVDNLENIKLDNHMDHNLRVGDLVISNGEMNEADFMEKEEVWIHAKKGDVGFVEHITDDGYPTIRFNESGTATICHVDELVILKNVDNIPLFDKEVNYNISVLTDMLVK